MRNLHTLRPSAARVCRTGTLVILGVLPAANTALAAAATQGPQPQPAVAQDAPVARDPVAVCLQDRVKVIRAEEGVQPVAEHPVLLQLAQSHSDEMAAVQNIYHSGAEALSALPLGWRFFGEDVVRGPDCETMWTAFMESAPHKEAILRPEFNYSAAAVARGAEDRIYATVVLMNWQAPLSPLRPPQLRLIPPKAKAKPAPITPSPTSTLPPALAQAPVPEAKPTPTITLTPPAPPPPVGGPTAAPGPTPALTQSAPAGGDAPLSPPGETTISGAEVLGVTDQPEAALGPAPTVQTDSPRPPGKSAAYLKTLEADPDLAPAKPADESGLTFTLEPSDPSQPKPSPQPAP